MTAILNKVKDKLKSQSSIPVDELMQIALYDKEHGYYTTKKHVLGAEGDFTTAPEISQLFGETLSLWVAHIWQLMKSPSTFTLVELGPGRGTLMADMLRSLQKVLPELYNNLTIYMVEISPNLQQVQREQLGSFKDKISWINTIEDLPNLENSAVIGNEIIDALPLKQFSFSENLKTERVVKLDDNNQLTFAEEESNTDLSQLNYSDSDKTVEWHPNLDAFILKLKEKMQKGYILFIDYGDLGWADTLQALQKHETADILTTLGEADLTMQVNFAHLRQLLGAQTSYNEMRNFLAEFAIGIRAAQLVRQNPAMEEQITWQLKKLLSPDEMGTLFKVLMYRTEDLPETIGFSHANV